MGTMNYLSWAFALRDIEPESKLAAIYLAGVLDQDGCAHVDTTVAAIWCGFISPALREPRPWRFVASLQSIPSLSFKENATSVDVRIKL